MSEKYKETSVGKPIEIDKKMLTSAKILERMVNINLFDDIAKDYRFYEDPADEVTYPEGSLMPLWKFQVCNERKDLEVTGLQWSPRYADLFGVTLGSFDFYQNSNERMPHTLSISAPPTVACSVLTSTGTIPTWWW